MLPAAHQRQVGSKLFLITHFESPRPGSMVGGRASGRPGACCACSAYLAAPAFGGTVPADGHQLATKAPWQHTLVRRRSGV